VVAKFKPDEPLLTRAVNLKKDAKKSAYVTKDKNGKPKVYVASSPGVEQDPKSPGTHGHTPAVTHNINVPHKERP